MTEMSALVPPMSSVMSLLSPVFSPANCPERTPPAGPDSNVVIGFLVTCRTLASPPLDCMICRSTSNPSSDSRSWSRVRYWFITGASRALIAVEVNRSYSRN
jgi:hypothetical protein